MMRVFSMRAAALGVALSAVLCGGQAQAQASDPFIGQMMVTAANYCPNGWQEANGAILPIASNSALFSLLGTTYGGNGTTHFAVPDMRGRVAVGQGGGPGLSYVSQGDVWGTENVTLMSSQMPIHVHTQSVLATTDAATHSAPSSTRQLAHAQNAGVYAETGGPTVAIAAGITGVSGGSQPFSVRNPSLGMRWCICTQGIFPQHP